MLKRAADADETNRTITLNKIAEYRFAALETALYLDTHPNDTNVLNRHNEYCARLKELCEEYTATYNDPLSIYEAAYGSWTYIERWPNGLDCTNSMYKGGNY